MEWGRDETLKEMYTEMMAVGCQIDEVVTA